MFHIPLAFMLPTTAAIRNRVQTYFGFDDMELEIVCLYYQELDGDGVVSIQMANNIWAKRREKIVIWVQFPWQQELLYLFIKEVGIDVRQYHSGLGSRERQQLVKSFHEEQLKAMVNVLTFKPGPSTPVEFQAIGRSWNEWEEGNVLVKELPALMAELNMNILGANEDPDADPAVSLGDRDISIKRYVLFDNRLVLAEERLSLNALSMEELLKHISRMLKDQRNFRSKLRKQI
ncbi:MAG: hypothetical protein M1839_004751 [Geoglossum umbratile]|nr:MAG: hypothetical protein M1839_004751 [Geoglossum umbratile]